MRVLMAVGAALSLLLIAAPALAAPDGLVLWLKADSGLATDGSSWKDKSGQHHDATALAGQAPAYVAGAVNGLPVARFSGGQVMSLAGAVLDSQTFTILAVATDTSTKGAAGFREIISNWDSSTQTSSVFLGTVWGTPKGKLSDRIRFTDAIGGADQGQPGVGKIKQPAKVFVLSGVSLVNDAVVRLDGKVEYKLGAALPTRDLLQGWYIGRQGTRLDEYWTGDIAEVMVFDKALSTQELQAQIDYLTQKWE